MKPKPSMQLKVVKLTANGNVVLQGAKVAIERKRELYYKGKKVGFVFDTIASESSPFYLGKIEQKELLGKILEVH